METLADGEKEDCVKTEHQSLGPQGEGNQAPIPDAEECAKGSCDVPPPNLEKAKKDSTISSSLKKLVQSRSKNKNDQDEKRDDSPCPTKDEKPQKNSKITKVFQNVSSSMNLRRVWGSSSATRVTCGDGEKPESQKENESQGKFGKLFKRKSLSKTDLETETNGEDLNKVKLLGNIFGRKSNSKTDVIYPENMNMDKKSFTLGRRLSSTFRGAFGKSERQEAQSHEAP